MSKASRRVREIPITKFKANCLALVADVHRRGSELIITNHGRPVARLVSATPTADWRSPAAAWKGRIEIRGDLAFQRFPGKLVGVFEALDHAVAHLVVCGLRLRARHRLAETGEGRAKGGEIQGHGASIRASADRAISYASASAAGRRRGATTQDVRIEEVAHRFRGCHSPQRFEIGGPVGVHQK